MPIKKPARKSVANKSVSKPSAKTKPAPAKAVPKEPAPKPANPGAAAGSAAEADSQLHSSAYTLPALLQRIAEGATITFDSAMVYIDVPSDQLVELGQQVRTERIDIDTARLYGTALDFFNRSTPQQRRAVPGLTRQRLRVCIWAAAQGQKQNFAVLAAKEDAAAAQTLRTTDAQQVKTEAAGLRKVLHATLQVMTGGQKMRLEELRTSYGRSEKPQELADSLVALATLLDRYLGDPDPKITARRAEMQLDGELSAQARVLATQVLLRGSSEKTPRTATPNAEVDRWDGINLLLLDQLIAIFEAGHELDPTVPRLLPQALRGWFGRSRSNKPEPSPTPGQPDGVGTAVTPAG